MDLNLEYIDSKEWFKRSKGISAATFTKITPVAPVVKMSREDSRFIEGYEVTDKLDERHGHKAKIDLKEAKERNNQNNT